MATKKRTATATRKKATRKKATRKKATRKKKSTRKYGEAAAQRVGRALHKMKNGTLRSGRGGAKVTNPKQAIAIGLSEARKRGAKVPKQK